MLLKMNSFYNFKDKIKKKDLWEFEKLKMYLNYVKGFEPALTAKADSIIQRYY